MQLTTPKKFKDKLTDNSELQLKKEIEHKLTHTTFDINHLAGEDGKKYIQIFVNEHNKQTRENVCALYMETGWTLVTHEGPGKNVPQGMASFKFYL